MTRDNDDRNYAVGYGKPPKNTRFKKGQSGNPRGRPKGAKNIATLLKERLYSKVTISENGRRKQITMIEALFRKLLKSALEGDPRSQDRLIRLLPLAEDETGMNGDAGHAATTGETDEAILSHFIEAGGTALLGMVEERNEDDA